MDTYFEFTIVCNDVLKEILIAELAEVGYDGFLDHDNGFSAFIPQNDYNEEVFAAILQKYKVNPADVPHNVIAPQNWNAQWEAGYEPILVADKIIVRAPFHKIDKTFAYELIIQPKNTFGTGHHETTQLMLELMLNIPMQDKTILDYGCGTGVLGLMALKLGAKKVVGIDIDNWCTDNIEENKLLNGLDDFEFRLGDLSVIQSNEKFDGVLANINKNILLHSFQKLVSHINPNSLILISGFYESDLEDIQKAAMQFNLQLNNHIVKNNWCAAHLQFVNKTT